MDVTVSRCAVALSLWAWMSFGDVTPCLAQDTAFTRELSLSHGAFQPRDLPNVIVHGKRSAAGAPIELVVFLHGHSSCAKALVVDGTAACGDKLVAGQGLIAQHDAAGTDALLVVPQLALLRRSGFPGAFAKPGGFRVFLRELLDEALVDELGHGAFARISDIVIVAHSAGYQTTLAILARGDMDELIRDVVLLDSLYRGTQAFQSWLQGDAGRRLISLHSGRGKPANNTRHLERALRRDGYETLDLDSKYLDANVNPQLRSTLPSFRFAFAKVSTPHRDFPRIHFAWVTSIALAKRNQSLQVSQAPRQE